MRLASLILAGMVASCASPVAAQYPLAASFDNGIYFNVFQEERLEDGAIAEVVHRNMQITGKAGDIEFLEYETPYGKVILRVDHTDNRLCDYPCPDTVEAWELPNGFVSYPTILVTPEGGFGFMTIRRWQGM